MPQLCEEGGKRHLAESLWENHKYEIRCATCPGNQGKPGFIKDQAGKATADNLGRRYWTCQRSNGQGITQRCGRISCSELIHLAKNQLAQQWFEQTFYTVCESRITSLKDCEALRVWTPKRPSSDQSTIPPPLDPPLLPPHPLDLEITLEGISQEFKEKERKTPTEKSSPLITSHKRKGSEGSFPPSKKLEINPPNPQPSPSTPSDPDQSLSWSKLQITQKHLTVLVKIGQSWAEDLELITRFLQSSNLSTHCPSPTGSQQSSIPIPSPTGSPQSSISIGTVPESDWEKETEPSSPPKPTSPDRVEELIQEFLQISTQTGSELSLREQRRGIRQRAKKEGLGAQFQTRLSHEQGKQSISRG